MGYKYLLAVCCLAVITVGCSKNEVPDLPIARAELTARLLEALSYDRFDEALGIIDKLLALSPDDVELMEMKTRIITNKCTASVQQYIDQGQLDEALAFLRGESKKHPMIRKFTLMEDQVLKLIKLRDAANKLAAADEVAALEDAIAELELCLKDYPKAIALHDDLKKRKLDLTRLRKEKILAEAQAKARAEAEAKAKEAAAKAKAQAEASAKAAAEAQARADAAKAKAEEEFKNGAGNQFVGPQRPR